MTGALGGLRVIDMAGPFGNYCGKLFADMGADVILVEPPEGAPTRHRPPLDSAEGRPFTFLYENAGKRSICLDLGTAADRAHLRRLAGTADLLVESR